eukprot:tig00020912_g15804.t1
MEAFVSLQPTVSRCVARPHTVFSPSAPVFAATPSSSAAVQFSAAQAAFVPPTLPAVPEALSGLFVLLADAANTAADAAASGAADAEQSKGLFDMFVVLIENALKTLEGSLDGAGVPYAYGFAIILFTVFVKILTLPLSQKQMTSALSMQALQPKMKEIQKRYANDPQKMQLETAALYRSAGVNPLAGCLPSLATLPIWIGLYRALTSLAKEGVLTKGFFFIPSLAGPATIDNPGLSWLIPFTDGAPPVGWADCAAYLVLPVLLVASQVYTMKMTTPQTNDPQQQQANAILKFLPFMLGYFSLTMPSGLSLYWFTNNILSTAQQWYIKKTFKASSLKPSAPAGAPMTVEKVVDVSSSAISSNGSKSPAAASSAPAKPTPSTKGGSGKSKPSKKSKKGKN